ncbi:MAG: hypothetical protein ABI867_29955 [Kofleriaceae bacterium]
MLGKVLGLGKPSGAEFTSLVASLGTERGYFVDPQIDPAAMTIVAANARLSLQPMYEVFLELPRKDRQRFIDEVVLGALDSSQEEVPEPDWDSVRSMLLPVIRDAGYLACAALEIAQLAGDDPAPEIAYRELAPGLFTTLVIDDANHMSLVTQDMLAHWDVRFDIAFEIALAKLEGVSDAPFQQIAPGLWAAPWSDSYTAARLLLPDLVHRLCASPLVAIPDRNTLLVADPAAPNAFETLMGAISQADDPYPITRRIFQLEGETLREIAPPHTDAGAAFARMFLDEKLEAYEREKTMHREACPYAEEVLISLKGLARGDDTFTTAVWTQHVEHGLLPPADFVLFQEWKDELGPQGAGKTWPVPWSRVVTEPSLVTATTRPLPRWKCLAFPSRVWLEQHSQPLGPARR